MNHAKQPNFSPISWSASSFMSHITVAFVSEIAVQGSMNEYPRLAPTIPTFSSSFIPKFPYLDEMAKVVGQYNPLSNNEIYGL